MNRQGYLVFHGGDAFVTRSRESDRAWLKLIRKAQRKPRLVVVPAAELLKPQKLADKTARYYNSLDVLADFTAIVDRVSATQRAQYQILNEVDAIVLIDGSPVDLVERVRGTRTEEAIRRGPVERKMVLMGAGAGAMALGAVFWMANQWEPGLGIAPQLAILPRHNLVQMRLNPARLLADLPEGVTLIGVDEATAVIMHPDNTCEVAGEGRAVVYRSAKQVDEYQAKQRFALNG